MTTEQPFSPRKIGVCGSSKKLSSEAADFCAAIGRSLAADRAITIVSGGTKKRDGTPQNDFAADWHFVNAAETALKSVDPGSVSERVVTVVREDSSGTTSFRIGTIKYAIGKTSEARRIAFIRGVDALIAVGGRGGTDQELALAMEFRIPILPVPRFEGKAKDFWSAYRTELIKALRIDEAKAKQWEEQSLLTPTDVQELADDMVAALLTSLPPRCFVIMPFDEKFDQLFKEGICPAVQDAGGIALRVDQEGVPGDAVRQISDGIRNCAYAIVVLDDLRPNVIYELGMAHAWGKSTILLNRKGALGSHEIPFDLSTQQRIEYEEIDSYLCDRLRRMIPAGRRVKPPQS